MLQTPWGEYVLRLIASGGGPQKAVPAQFRKYAELAMQTERCSVDQASFAKICCDTLPGIESLSNFLARERTHSAGDREIEEIGVGSDVAGGNS
jgi:hypothetical protein